VSSCRYVTYPDPQISITPYLPFKFKIGKSEFTFPVEFQELLGLFYVHGYLVDMFYYFLQIKGFFFGIFFGIKYNYTKTAHYQNSSFSY
jgi:hypothetical protein